MDLYLKERNKYPFIAKSIIDFETTFTAIFSYHIINYYKIKDYSKLIIFHSKIENLILNDAIIDYSTKRRRANGIQKSLEEYNQFFSDPYNYLNSMTIGKKFLFFRYLPNDLRHLIFNDICKFDESLGCQSLIDFDSRISKMSSIRNTVFHCKSLEILLRYYNVKYKQLRTSGDKRSYAKLIKYLKFKGQTRKKES